MINPSLLFLLLAPLIASGDWQFHTSPERWQEPRLFHAPFEGRYSERIVLERMPRGEMRPIHHSPNGGYSILDRPKGSWEVEAEDTVRCVADSRDVTLWVDTERDQALAVRIYDRYPNFGVSARWINEKLIFLRVWWGRVLGTDVIIDVEQERMIHREMVFDGGIAFQQFAQEREGGSPD